MRVFLVILMFLGIIALFVTMIVAAAMHSWFAFVGYFLAWVISLILLGVSAAN